VPTEWIAPFLGLLGTISATAVGLYQWRKTDRQRRTAKYANRRAEVMEALVQRLQQIQVLSRSEVISTDDMTAQTRGLDHFLIENRLWLDEPDSALAREYLHSLNKIHEAIQGDFSRLGLRIGTMPEGVYGEDVARLFAQLGHAENKLVTRARRAMRISGG
jgi:DNA-binding helix-hairpin-helix protein with protein kinase domain